MIRWALVRSWRQEYLSPRPCSGVNVTPDKIFERGHDLWLVRMNASERLRSLHITKCSRCHDIIAAQCFLAPASATDIRAWRRAAEMSSQGLSGYLYNMSVYNTCIAAQLARIAIVRLCSKLGLDLVSSWDHDGPWPAWCP